MYLQGRIEENSFDKESIIREIDSQGNDVSRNFSITKENCQWAKILSAPIQRKARLKMIAEAREKEIKRSKVYMILNQRSTNIIEHVKHELKQCILL